VLTSRVDLALLADTAGELRGLASQFTQVSARRADSISMVGHPSVVAALDDFGRNWRRHGEKLTKHLDAVAAMALESGRTYRAVDAKLAHTIEKPGHTS
jgi:hypothetical protein